MKRAFAIIIVVLLALGMIGLFFPVLLSSQGASAPAVQTAPAPEAGSAPTAPIQNINSLAQ